MECFSGTRFVQLKLLLLTFTFSFKHAGMHLLVILIIVSKLADTDGDIVIDFV